MAKTHRRLSPADPLTRIVDVWLFQLGTRKPSERTLTAYRADIEGVARRIDSDGAAVLHLEDLTKPALRGGFASWAARRSHGVAPGWSPGSVLNLALVFLEARC